MVTAVDRHLQSFRTLSELVDTYAATVGWCGGLTWWEIPQSPRSRQLLVKSGSSVMSHAVSHLHQYAIRIPDDRPDVQRMRPRDLIDSAAEPVRAPCWFFINQSYKHRVRRRTPIVTAFETLASGSLRGSCTTVTRYSRSFWDLVRLTGPEKRAFEVPLCWRCMCWRWPREYWFALNRHHGHLNR